MAPVQDVQVREVSRSYGGTRAVDRVSFDVEQGHVLSLLGPSGCGKTTMLRMVAGLLSPDAGEIAIKGRSVTHVPVHRRNIGMLFQNYALFPHMSVADNVAFGLQMRNAAKAEIQDRVSRALQLVRLDGFASRMPHQLSGGQQQRVALARALVIEPAVLLLDEPLGALDKKLRENMQIELRELQQRLAITTIMVTHDQDEALTLSDRIAVMRDGRIEQIGAPDDVYERPVSRFVASFIGTANFFRGKVVSSSGGEAVIEAEAGIALTLPTSGTAALGPVTVALRPESIRVRPASGETGGPNHTVATIDQVIYRGLSTYYHMRLPSGAPLMAFRQNAVEAQTDAPLRPGDAVLASWNAERNLLVQDEL